MLSRVCAGQESLKQGLPPGTKACRTVGEQVAQISRNLPALARPSPDLPPIRTSSRPLQTSIVLPKTQFAALQVCANRQAPCCVSVWGSSTQKLMPCVPVNLKQVQSPFQSEAGQVPQSADQQNLSPQVPTPTAFQLDSSPRRVGSSPLPGPTTQRNGPTGGSKSRPSVSLDAVPVVSLVCPNTASQHLGI